MQKGGRSWTYFHWEERILLLGKERGEKGGQRVLYQDEEGWCEWFRRQRVLRQCPRRHCKGTKCTEKDVEKCEYQKWFQLTLKDFPTASYCRGDSNEEALIWRQDIYFNAHCHFLPSDQSIGFETFAFVRFSWKLDQNTSPVLSWTYHLSPFHVLTHVVRKYCISSMSKLWYSTQFQATNPEFQVQII